MPGNKEITQPGKSKDAGYCRHSKKRNGQRTEIDRIPEEIAHVGALKGASDEMQRTKQHCKCRERVCPQKDPQDFLGWPHRTQKGLEFLQLIDEISVHKYPERQFQLAGFAAQDRTLVAVVHPLLRIRSEEHTSELQSRFGISYAVFFLK